MVGADQRDEGSWGRHGGWQGPYPAPGSSMHPDETPGAAEFRGVTGAGGRRMHKQNHRNEGKLAVEQGREYGAPSLQSASREYTPPRAQLTSKTPSLI